MFVFRLEKKLRITLYFFFPFRFFTRIYEIFFFKNYNKNLNIKKVSNYYLDLSKIINKEINVVSAGIAYNTQFEEQLALEYKVKNLILIDPNIASKEFAKKRIKNFHFENKVLYNQEAEKFKIFKPPHYKEVNLSIDNTFATKDFELVDTISVNTVKQKYHLSTIDILKLDVEGVADYVIIDCINKKIFPNQICFEVERPYSIFRQVEFFLRVNKLKNILNKFYNIYYYTDLKLGIRIELLAIYKDHSQK
jgi:esterase/lipase